MNDTTFLLHGPQEPHVPLLLDSPHSGFQFPADFDTVVSEFDLRDGEDCFVDEFYMPATELGIPLLAALPPRTYLDPNRHAGDIDLDLIEGGASTTSTDRLEICEVGQSLWCSRCSDVGGVLALKIRFNAAAIQTLHQTSVWSLTDASSYTQGSGLRVNAAATI